MAAVSMHMVDIVMRPVLNGVVLDPNTMTIQQKMNATTEMRIKEDSSIPSSLGYPTIENFIKLEAAAGFKVAVINQSWILLYPA